MSCEQKNTDNPDKAKLEQPEARIEYEIHWGGKVFRFKTIEQALAAGFQL